MGFFGLIVTVAVVLCGAYVLWRPHWAMILIMVMFPLEQLIQSGVPYFQTHGWIINVAIGLLAMAGVATAVFRRQPVFDGYMNPVSIMLFALYALTVVGIFYSPVREFAAENVISSVPYWVLLAAVLPLLLTTVRDLERLFTGLLIVGTILSILVLVNPATGWYGGRLHMDFGVNVLGTQYSSPLALGTLGGIISIIAILMKPVRATALLQIVRVTALFVGLGLAIGSGSRGQVFGALVTGALFLPISRRMKDPKQFLLTCAGVAIFAVICYLTFRQFIGEENRQRWSSLAMGEATGGRLARAMELLVAWAGSPVHYLFGLGTGGWSGITSAMNSEGHVHNKPVEALGEFGLVGFSLFMGILWLGVVYGRRLWSAYRDDPHGRSYVTILLALTFYDLLLSLKSGSIVGHPGPLNLVFIVAKIYVHENRVGLRESVPWVDDDEVGFDETGTTGIDGGGYDLLPNPV